MEKNNTKLNCPPILKQFLLQKESGVVLLITLLFMLGIAVLGMGVIINASLNVSIAKNYAGKLQSFYAADAQVGMLAQEVYDGNADKYLGSGSCSGGGNIITNCDFASNTIGWRAWHGTGVWDNGRFHKTTNDSGATGTIDNSDVTQTGLKYYMGYTYLVSFYAKASVPDKYLLVECQHDGDDGSGNYTIYNPGNINFYLDTTMSLCSFYWCMNTATDNHARVAFKVGGQGTFGVWLDNVVIARVDSNTSANLALNKTATSSTNQSGYPQSNAVDGNTTTRWASSSADNQWITVDLGKACLVNTVALKWEAAYATNYEILVSSDNSTWYQAYQNFSGHGGSEIITFSPQIARYVRMHGISRAWIWNNGCSCYQQYGFSLWEFEVYGSTGGRTGSDTTYVGSDSVAWNLQEVIPQFGYTITSKAYKKFATGKTTFNTQLSQYVELPSGGLVNPYGAVAKVPVTYYDFHSDRTNPEFEQPHCGTVTATKNMVAATLDGERKPQVGSVCFLSKNITKWFRPWTYYTSAQNKVIPVYSQSPARNSLYTPEYGCSPANAWVSNNTVTWDTAFKNFPPIQDTLFFTHIGNGMYQYINDYFFPLDNRGLGNEWNQALAAVPSCDTCRHNYAFTMQIQSTFTKVPGQRFYFTGDDDVWLFINNNLVMDMGGCHQKLSDSVIVDNLSLTDGQTYNFDFFYCERHSNSAHCEIMTNLLTYHSFTQKQVKWKQSYGNID